MGSGCENPIVLKKDLTILEDKLNKSENTKSLDLNERCSENAYKFFKNKNYNPNNSTFTNHWNKKLSKCFISIVGIEQIENSIVFSKELRDVLEGEGYASFSEIGRNDKNPICYLYENGSDEPGKSCNKVYEYDDFIKPYMNE